MDKDPTAIQIRFSKAQMSIIWGGINFLGLAWLTREKTGTCLTAYPFQIVPLPQGYDAGTFGSAMMKQVLAVWARLRPNAETGGIVELNAIGVRIAIFSARVNLDARRKQARDERGKDDMAKRRLGVDKESIHKLRDNTQSLIKSLETDMKRADRSSLKVISRSEFATQSKECQAHLKWMKYHIAYFKPFSALLPKQGISHRKEIDQLVTNAEAGFRDQAYEIPDAKKLRHMMRLFAQSSRRGREMPHDHRWVTRILLGRLSKA